MDNLSVFLIHGSQNFDFLKEIKHEYETNILGLESNSSKNENNSELKEEDIKEKVNELFFSKLTESEIEIIQKEHKLLSEGLGISVGLCNRTVKGELIKEEISTIFEQLEIILKSIVIFLLSYLYHSKKTS